MDMVVKVPALRGRMGGRTYFTVSMKLKTVPRFFAFQNYKDLEPEERAQRVLNKNRVPAIKDYLLQNGDGYVFSSITASYQLPEGVTDEDLFEPIREGSDIGTLTLPMEADLLINDGQHRRAGITAALEEDPALGEDDISVVLFPFEDHTRAQQMFSDLNRAAVATTKSLNILYDHRDRLSNITMLLTTTVDAFVDRVDKERASLSKRSPALVTLGGVHDGTKELVGTVTDDNFAEKRDLAIAFWQTIASAVPQWAAVTTGTLTAPQVREETISTHTVTLRAMGEAGRTLMETVPDGWQTRLAQVFGNLDWSRKNPEWRGVVLSETGDVVNRRQNQRDLAELLRVKLGVASSEERLRRLVHRIGYERAELALTARLRSADTRPDAVKDVKELEASNKVPFGTTAELEELLSELYQPTVFDGIPG
jgi:DNA sulfur modification protein DndB